MRPFAGAFEDSLFATEEAVAYLWQHLEVSALVFSLALGLYL